MLILTIISLVACGYTYYKCNEEQRKVILAIMLYMFGLYCLSGV